MQQVALHLENGLIYKIFRDRWEKNRKNQRINWIAHYPLLTSQESRFSPAKYLGYESSVGRGCMELE